MPSWWTHNKCCPHSLLPGIEYYQWGAKSEHHHQLSGTNSCGKDKTVVRPSHVHKRGPGTGNTPVYWNGPQYWFTRLILMPLRNWWCFGTQVKARALTIFRMSPCFEMYQFRGSFTSYCPRFRLISQVVSKKSMHKNVYWGHGVVSNFADLCRYRDLIMLNA